MPTISTFYGIKITMNYNDHQPPHFHAEYQSYEALVGALNMVWTWLDLHRGELYINWIKHVKDSP